MPKIYRSMRKGDHGKPLVDASGKGLGVRVEPVNAVADIEVDHDGKVILNQKGMSVAPAWRDLPIFLIPKRLRDKVPSARGSKELYCFTHGTGPFTDAPVADGLDLVIDTSTHGVVVPRVAVSVSQYQLDLANTRDHWVVDEA